MRLMALDPGGTTGIAKWDSDDPELILTDQLARQQHHSVLWEELYRFDPNIVICEEFVYQIRKHQGTTMPGVELISREYIGVAKLYCDLNSVEFFLSRLANKTFWSDNKLRKVGYYRPSAPHANDATRHLLNYLVNNMGQQSWLFKLRD